MLLPIFLFWLGVATALIFYSLHKRDWTSPATAMLSSAIFWGLAFASFNIQQVWAFLTNATAGNVTVYVYTSYDTGLSYLCYAMGFFSAVICVVKLLLMMERTREVRL